MSELSFGSTKRIQLLPLHPVNSGKLSPAIAEFGTSEDIRKSLHDDEKSFSLSNAELSKSTSMSAISHHQGGKDPVGKQPVSGHKSFDSTKPHTLTDEVVHVAAETYLLTHLTIILLGYLGLGYKWITKCIALMFYAAFLMPGFIQIGWYYFFSKKVHRSIIYGDQPRNRLDLYLPLKLDKPKPAVAFVTGGAWIIGYKAWGALLAQELVEEDVIVACIDYRNFPQGTVSDMVADVSRGLAFFCENIAEYGGDPDRLYLAGQSAGAHLSACALMEQVRKEILNGNDHIPWHASQFKAYFGISGGYNLPDLMDHFHRQGLYRSIFLSIMEGEDSMSRYSPEVVIKNSNLNVTASMLPQIVLLHGTADYSIPYEASITFADALRARHINVTSILYEGKTHTDLFLQDPMRGGKDELLRDILAIINEDDEEAKLKFNGSPPRRRLVPEMLLQLARKVSPF